MAEQDFLEALTKGWGDKDSIGGLHDPGGARRGQSSQLVIERARITQSRISYYFTATYYSKESM